MLTRFYVKGLFGMSDNEIIFREKEKITVIVGSNGCGKTTMLHMLDAIFSRNHSRLLKYRFDYIEVDIDEHVLKIEPFEEYVEEDGLIIHSLKYYIDGDCLYDIYRETNKINSPTFWIRAIPSLRRMNRDLLTDMRTGEVLTIEEVVNDYFDELPDEIKNDLVGIPLEVWKLVGNLQIELISTDRLKKISREEFRRADVVQRYAVEECSDDLQNRLKTLLSEYANLSQKLDQQLPSKILEAIKQQRQFSEKDLNGIIQRIDALRKKHVKAGVLEENNANFLGVDVESERLDKITSIILSVYYDDMEEKLKSLNDISDKVVLFRNMIENKFSSNKKIEISKDKGIVMKQIPKDEEVELRFLSSGEQQEFVLLYNLIFKGEQEKLVLIDEPEISLNVSWQREFLEDMKKIVEMNKINMLIATHSPQIINDNWDLVETLGDVE